MFLDTEDGQDAPKILKNAFTVCPVGTQTSLIHVLDEKTNTEKLDFQEFSYNATQCDIFY
jgi:hypothetical protein